MFEPWFWLTFSAFFFNSLYYYNKQKGMEGTMDTLTAIGMLGLSIFWIIGLFCADRWWQPLAALGISMFGSGIVAAIFPQKIMMALGVISPVISIILTIAAYVIWF